MRHGIEFLNRENTQLIVMPTVAQGDLRDLVVGSSGY